MPPLGAGFSATPDHFAKAGTRQNRARLQFRVFGDIVLKETFAFVHGSYRDAIRVLTRSDPLPCRIDLGTREIASLGLKDGSASEDHGDHFFPFVGPNYRHARDMVGISLEEAHFIPTCLPIRTFHLRKIGKDPDRTLFPFA